MDLSSCVIPMAAIASSSHRGLAAGHSSTWSKSSSVSLDGTGDTASSLQWTLQHQLNVTHFTGIYNLQLLVQNLTVSIICCHSYSFISQTDRQTHTHTHIHKKQTLARTQRTRRNRRGRVRAEDEEEDKEEDEDEVKTRTRTRTRTR